MLVYFVHKSSVIYIMDGLALASTMQLRFLVFSNFPVADLIIFSSMRLSIPFLNNLVILLSLSPAAPVDAFYNDMPCCKKVGKQII